MLERVTSQVELLMASAHKVMRFSSESSPKHIGSPSNYRKVLKGDNPDQNIKLEPGDTVVGM
jgi:hypothetical protein